jgi:hypothetical protein
MWGSNMIAEEIATIDKPSELSDAEGKTLECIITCITKTLIYFKKARLQPDIKRNLNEINLTQIFVQLAEFQVRKFPDIGVNSQYSDIFFGTKGFPDFYFYKLEENRVHKPLFVVESKRLPAPKPRKKREKEYVIGYKDNGGIERFKKEIHGKNLDDCGMLGFIESGTSSLWLEKINLWITNLAETDRTWKVDEQLFMKDNAADYSYLVSTVYISSDKNVILHHWWIICEDDIVQNAPSPSPKSSSTNSLMVL